MNEGMEPLEPEIVHGPADALVALTCEHASDHFPHPYRLEGPDARLAGTHWAIDLGARELTLELAKALGAPAVLARCSRLVVDVNRGLDAPTLFRGDADGLAIELNRDLGPEERQTRIARFYEPYHRAVDAMIAGTRAPLLFAVHSFTDEYEGSPREMELGILFDREDELGAELAAACAVAGFHTAENEPWSGKDGLIYSADRHAAAHERRALELEVRQDRCLDPAFRARLVPVLVRALTATGTRLRAAAERR